MKSSVIKNYMKSPLNDPKGAYKEVSWIWRTLKDMAGYNNQNSKELTITFKDTMRSVKSLANELKT